jgi:FkbM family methyltransferase
MTIDLHNPLPRLANELTEELARHIALSQKKYAACPSPWKVRRLRTRLLLLVARAFERTLRVKAVPFWRQRMLVVFPEPISVAIYRDGFYEPGLTTMLLRFLREGMTFVDVGAHFGYFSLLAADRVGQAGSVYCFEPSPSTFSVLELNVHDVPNIVAENKAVWSRGGVLSFGECVPEFSAFSSFYSPRIAEDQKQRVRIQKRDVPAISLDEYVEARGLHPDFIKIDAESAEMEVLRGMQTTFSRFQPMVTLEVGDASPDAPVPSRELVHYVVARGYQAFEYTGGAIIPHKVRDTYIYDNLLFVPNSRTADNWSSHG